MYIKLAIINNTRSGVSRNAQAFAGPRTEVMWKQILRSLLILKRETLQADVNLEIPLQDDDPPLHIHSQHSEDQSKPISKYSAVSLKTLCSQIEFTGISRCHYPNPKQRTQRKSFQGPQNQAIQCKEAPSSIQSLAGELVQRNHLRFSEIKGLITTHVPLLGALINGDSVAGKGK